jgi:hypothetical protein
MSSCEGHTLESWVIDSFGNVSYVIMMATVRLLESNRESIENMIGDFDEDNQSWRDYRNSLWNYYEDLNPTIDKLCSIPTLHAQAACYLFTEIGDTKLTAFNSAEMVSMDEALTSYLQTPIDYNKPESEVRTEITSIFFKHITDLGQEIIRNMTCST